MRPNTLPSVLQNAFPPVFSSASELPARATLPGCAPELCFRSQLCFATVIPNETSRSFSELCFRTCYRARLEDGLPGCASELRFRTMLASYASERGFEYTFERTRGKSWRSDTLGGNLEAQVH